MGTRTRPTILFLCVHNAGRSQMAAAFARSIGAGLVTVHSAGTDPADRLNPAVPEAMREVSLDLTRHTPRRLSEKLARRADVIVTMGCGDRCPVYVGKRYLDWTLVDPSGQSIETVRVIRDEIEQRVRDLIHELVS